MKSRRGAPIKLESLQKHFDWAVRYELLNDSLDKIADDNSVTKRAVVKGIKFIMNHLPLPQREPEPVRQRILALRSLI